MAKRTKRALTSCVRNVVLLMAVLGFVPRALAQPDKSPRPPKNQAPPAKQRPWARNVSMQKQAKARKIASQGVEFFARGQCALALDKYRKALNLWNHPAIRYNMVECLMRFGQLLQAYESLEEALRFGAAPFASATHYSEGLLRRKLLLKRLARLEVVSNQPGVRVTLDGKKLLDHPGKITRFLLAGQHQLVASKEGHLTITRQLMLEAGKLQRESLVLIAMKIPVRMKRRWRRWLPWMVTGVGAVVALAGVPIRLLAQSNLGRYDEAISAGCDDADGCTPEEILDSTHLLKSRAMTQDKAAISLFVVGGAALVTGMVMAFLNQPRAVASKNSQQKTGNIRFLPVVGTDHIAVITKFSF